MFPHLIEIGPLRVASYGVFVALGYLAGILWLKRQREQMGLSEDRFWTVIYSVFFGAVAGGKLMYILLNWQSFASGEMGLIRDFRYGFVWYGGVLGSLVAGWIVSRLLKISFGANADYFAVAAPIGHAIGRIGCLAAGCCHGGPTDLPWGLVYRDPNSLVPEALLGTPLHPSQLYEAAGNIAIGLFVWSLLQARQDGRVSAGVPFALYTLFYAALRFLIEFTRADDRGGWLIGLSPAQWTALALSAVAIAWLATSSRQGRAV